MNKISEKLASIKRVNLSKLCQGKQNKSKQARILDLFKPYKFMCTRCAQLGYPGFVQSSYWTQNPKTDFAKQKSFQSKDLDAKSFFAA